MVAFSFVTALREFCSPASKACPVQLATWMVSKLEWPKSEWCGCQDPPPIVARIVVKLIVITLIIIAVVDLVLPIPRN
jgi:hypothetical protein